MATNSELMMIIDRGLQALNELKAHAVQLGQLQQGTKEEQARLTSLQGQISQAQIVAAQVAETHQHLRAKRAELAELEATIARKHAEHGSIDGDLRTLMKRAQKLTEVT